MPRLLLCASALSLLCLSACKTNRPKDDETILVDPNLQDPPDESSSSQAATETPVQSPILSEPLQPVRGGLRVLPPYRGPDPCQMALAGESPVAKACSEGGRRKAIEMMTLFVKRAKAEGIIFVCADCHADEDDFSKLTSRAEAEFRKLLFLARPE